MGRYSCQKDTAPFLRVKKEISREKKIIGKRLAGE